MSERERTPGIGEGIRTGLGILGALKDALEETLQEAVERGDLAPERATRAMRDAARRFQDVVDDARVRVEPVARRDLEEMRTTISALEARIARLEAATGGPTGGGLDAGAGAAPGAPRSPSGIIVTDGD